MEGSRTFEEGADVREFVDDEGRQWDVVVGRESWGSLFALFIPRGGTSDGIRQTLMESVSTGDANQELMRCGADELKELFHRSQLKDTL